MMLLSASGGAHLYPARVAKVPQAAELAKPSDGTNLVSSPGMTPSQGHTATQLYVPEPGGDRKPKPGWVGREKLEGERPRYGGRRHAGMMLLSASGGAHFSCTCCEVAPGYETRNAV